MPPDLFFLRTQAQFHDQVEKLDGGFECQQPAMVKIWRRFLDAAQR